MTNEEIYPAKFFNNENSLDSSEKYKKGVFFTPKPIVDFIDNAIEEILADDFGIEDGFASQEVKVVDPAMGTGIFIYDVIARALQNNASQSHINQNFIGFELDSDNYQIAMQNITELCNEYQVSFKNSNFLNINTLTEEADEVINAHFNRQSTLFGA